MRTSVSRALGCALTGAIGIAFIFAGPAQADRRGAPIVYADAKSESASQTNDSRTAGSAPAVTESRRVEFVYPRQDVAAPTEPQLTVETRQETPTLSIGTSPTSEPAFTPQKPIRIASVQVQETARTGKPLTLSRVKSNRDAEIHEERGRAGVYMDGFDGQPTANGEIFDETAMTAAHPSLPLPSLVQVINEDNSREVVVRINDRGPFDGKRVLELSPRAADVLGVPKAGSAAVRIRYLGPAPVQQNPETYASTQIEDEPMAPVTRVQAPIRAAASPSAPLRSTPPLRVASLNVASSAAIGNVFIQAGAFSDIANAQRLISNIGGGLPVKIEEARVNGGDFFRVLVGPFPNRDLAERQRSELSRSGIVDGFLTTR